MTIESGTHSATRHSREFLCPGNHLKSLYLKCSIFKTEKKPCPTSPLIFCLLTERRTSRRRLGKERIRHDRSDVIVPNTTRKHWNDTRQPARMLSNGTWLHRQHTNNVYKMKKTNDIDESVMPWEPLLHAILSLVNELVEIENPTRCKQQRGLPKLTLLKYQSPKAPVHSHPGPPRNQGGGQLVLAQSRLGL